MDKRIVIAGCGFAGATIAHLAAEDGFDVSIYEKRNHIAGNMYDEIDENGILVQRYGPHSFHTYKKEVYDFVTSFSKWDEYILQARVDIDGKLTVSPFNFSTIDTFFEKEKAEEIKKHLREAFPGKSKATIVELLESEDRLIREYAEFLFENDYRPYTAKQWGIRPEELDISVLKRVPVRLDEKDAYFDDPYQIIPSDSFTKVFEEMLASEKIHIHLNEDIRNHISISETEDLILFDGKKLDCPLVYTGPIDELFNLKYGRLPYRSLYFDYQTHNVDSFQERSGVAYPKAEGYTRITEYKKIPRQDVPGVTTIAVEYPVPYMSEKGKEAYYPILTEASHKMYDQYRAETRKYSRLVLCGRLAEFKYYNMDEVISRAFAIYSEIADSLLK